MRKLLQNMKYANRLNQGTRATSVTGGYRPLLRKGGIPPGFGSACNLQGLCARHFNTRLYFRPFLERP